VIPPVPPILGPHLQNMGPTAVPVNPDEKVAVKQNMLVAGQTVPMVSDVKSPVNEDLKRALKKLNDDANRKKRSFKYVLDEEAQVIKVVDAETGDVIRVIPANEALDIALNLDRTESMIVQIKA